jgi:AcrR family transcriptional regulator
MPSHAPKNEAIAEDTPRRGRPVQIPEAERRERILDAATDLLCRDPLDDVTIAAICRRVRMSKRTVYELFSTREELLGTCLARIGASMFRPLSPEERGKSLDERLRALLTFNRVPFLAAPLELLRVMIAEAHTYPELARSFARDGHDKVVGLLSRELAVAARAGEIDLAPDRADEAAEMLFDMVYGGAVTHLLDPTRGSVDAAAKGVRRDRAIAIFLDGVRPR